MKRRKFIKNSISFSLLILLHKEAQSLAQLNECKKTSKLNDARFSEITLYTSKLEEQYEFYSEVLELPNIKKEKTEFSIIIGASTLIFKEVKDGTEPFYHYAINIPSNKYLEAKKWLSDRTPLLSYGDSGNDLLYFDFWDAHAMYFKDPSGNIGELIARHSLKNGTEGEFSVADLLCISEIGTPVENPSDFTSKLKATYGLKEYGESMFIGDENGLFVVVPLDRPWFPEYTQNAKIYPTRIETRDAENNQFKYKDYPYYIQGKK